MSDDSLEKHIQLDGRDETPANPAAPFSTEERSGGGNGGGNGGGGVPPSQMLPVGPVKQFYRDLIMVLTEPRLFFEVRYPETSFSYALAFGIIINWVAAFLEWLTRIIRHETLLDGFLKIRDRLQELPFWKQIPDSFWAQATPERSNPFPAWAAEALGIIASPFQTLFGFFFYGILIFLGAYLLVHKDSHRDSVELKNTIRIVSFASTPVLVSAILGFLPLNIGSFFGWIYHLILLAFALSLRFRVSGLRAFGIVILPGIVASFVMSCVVGVLVALLVGVAATIFGGIHT